MDCKQIDKINRKIQYAVAFIVSMLFVFLIWYKSGIYFETNDDRYINSLLSGVITGQPDAVVFHINYILSAPFAFLYRLSNKLPWYGLFLTGLYLFGYWVLLDSLYAKCKTYLEMTGATILGGITCISFWYLLGQIQFTSATIFIASVGYACLILDRDQKHCFIKFFICEILAVLWRKEAMLLVQPIGFGTYFCLLFLMKKYNVKDKLQKYGCVCGWIVITLLLEFMGTLIGGYKGSALNEFQHFSQDRALLFDYHQIPAYDEIADILQKHNVSREMYDGYLNYNTISYDISVDCQKEIVQYVSERQPYQIKNIFSGLISLYTKEQPWGINKLSLLFLITILILAIYTKDLPTICGVIGMECGKLVVWGFLFYRGRVLSRVSIPLFFCETIILLSLLFYNLAQLDLRSWVKYMISSAILLSSLFFGFSSARQQYRYIHEINEGQQIYMNGLREIIDYCREHENYHFILDSTSVSYYKGSAFETDIYRPGNYIISGGWFAALPSVRRHVTEFVSSQDGIYLVINSENNPNVEAILGYYRYLTGNEPVLIDQINTSIGGIYDVMYYSY